MSLKSIKVVGPFIALALLVLTGCPVDEFSDARITSLTLSRTTFAVSETGMTDEFIDAEVEFEGFIDPVDPDQSNIFLQDFDREAQPASSRVEGNVLFLDDITTSWLNVGVGEHAVGATLVTPTESVTQLNLVTVTITE